jgi:hypothetical protein
LNQNVHWLRRKLYRVDTILAGATRVLKTLSGHADSIRGGARVSEPSHVAFEIEVTGALREFESHKSMLDELLRISSDIKSMVRRELAGSYESTTGK